MTPAQLAAELLVERYGPLPPATEPVTPAVVDAWERCKEREQQLLRRRVLLDAVGRRSGE